MEEEAKYRPSGRHWPQAITPSHNFAKDGNRQSTREINAAALAHVEEEAREANEVLRREAVGVCLRGGGG